MILGVSFDTEADNSAFREKFGFPYDLLCDTDKAMSIAYGAAEDAGASHPSRISVIIDGEGVVKKVYPSVSPTDHPDEVLADLA